MNNKPRFAGGTISTKYGRVKIMLKVRHIYKNLFQEKSGYI